MPNTLTRVKTKIVATLGPATANSTAMTELVRAGADVFRLNMAHGDRDWHNQLFDQIESTRQQIRVPVAVLADLGGPKIRVGTLAQPIQCQAGGTVRLVRGHDDVQSENDFYATFENLVEEIEAKDRLLLADGQICLRVVSADRSSANCEVEQAGTIYQGAGINLPGSLLSVPSLTAKDRVDLQWLIDREVDYVGLSFVRSSNDVAELRSILEQHPVEIGIVSKIEKPQAVDDLDAIVEASDAIMVARGDLGVETDLARIALLQKEIIRKCNAAGKPVITATQMLESMREQRIPTRAEATDVANAILDGTDAVMLSAETAVGEYPRKSVEMMNRIAMETEKFLEKHGAETFPSKTVTEALVKAGGRIADEINAKLIIVVSNRGATALALSKQRNSTPTLGISHLARTAQKMSLYWGVTPVELDGEPTELLRTGIDWARQHNILRGGDRVVLLSGADAQFDEILVHEVT